MRDLNEEFKNINETVMGVCSDESKELTETKVKKNKFLKEARTPMDDIIDLKDKYDKKWLNAKVTEVKPSAHGKGYDITVIMKGYKDLPSIIQTDMVKKEVEKGQSVKVQLYISAGGILVDKIK